MGVGDGKRDPLCVLKETKEQLKELQEEYGVLRLLLELDD